MRRGGSGYLATDSVARLPGAGYRLLLPCRRCRVVMGLGGDVMGVGWNGVEWM